MRRALSLVVMVAGLMPAAAGRSADAFGQSTPDLATPEMAMPVMSDTAEYCTQLEHRIAMQPAKSAEIRRLVSKGHQLCDHGQARRGVTFMRRALIMQRAERAGAPP